MRVRVRVRVTYLREHVEPLGVRVRVRVTYLREHVEPLDARNVVALQEEHLQGAQGEIPASRQRVNIVEPELQDLERRKRHQAAGSGFRHARPRGLLRAQRLDAVVIEAQHSKER